MKIVPVCHTTNIGGVIGYAKRVYAKLRRSASSFPARSTQSYQDESNSFLIKVTIPDRRPSSGTILIIQLDTAVYGVAIGGGTSTGGLGIGGSSYGLAIAGGTIPYGVAVGPPAVLCGVGVSKDNTVGGIGVTNFSVLGIAVSSPSPPFGIAVNRPEPARGVGVGPRALYGIAVGGPGLPFGVGVGGFKAEYGIAIAGVVPLMGIGVNAPIRTGGVGVAAPGLSQFGVAVSGGYLPPRGIGVSGTGLREVAVGVGIAGASGLYGIGVSAVPPAGGVGVSRGTGLVYGIGVAGNLAAAYGIGVTATQSLGIGTSGTGIVPRYGIAVGRPDVAGGVAVSAPVAGTGIGVAASARPYGVGCGGSLADTFAGVGIGGGYAFVAGVGVSGSIVRDIYGIGVAGSGFNLAYGVSVAGRSLAFGGVGVGTGQRGGVGIGGARVDTGVAIGTARDRSGIAISGIRQGGVAVAGGMALRLGVAVQGGVLVPQGVGVDGHYRVGITGIGVSGTMGTGGALNGVGVSGGSSATGLLPLGVGIGGIYNTPAYAGTCQVGVSGTYNVPAHKGQCQVGVAGTYNIPAQKGLCQVGIGGVYDIPAYAGRCQVGVSGSLLINRSITGFAELSVLAAAEAVFSAGILDYAGVAIEATAEQSKVSSAESVCYLATLASAEERKHLFVEAPAGIVVQSTAGRDYQVGVTAVIALEATGSTIKDLHALEVCGVVVMVSAVSATKDRSDGTAGVVVFVEGIAEKHLAVSEYASIAAAAVSTVSKQQSVVSAARLALAVSATPYKDLIASAQTQVAVAGAGITAKDLVNTVIAGIAMAASASRSMALLGGSTAKLAIRTTTGQALAHNPPAVPLVIHATAAPVKVVTASGQALVAVSAVGGSGKKQTGQAWLSVRVSASAAKELQPVGLTGIALAVSASRELVGKVSTAAVALTVTRYERKDLSSIGSAKVAALVSAAPVKAVSAASVAKIALAASAIDLTYDKNTGYSMIALAVSGLSRQVLAASGAASVAVRSTSAREQERQGDTRIAISLTASNGKRQSVTGSSRIAVQASATTRTQRKAAAAAGVAVRITAGQVKKITVRGAAGVAVAATASRSLRQQNGGTARVAAVVSALRSKRVKAAASAGVVVSAGAVRVLRRSAVRTSAIAVRGSSWGLKQSKTSGKASIALLGSASVKRHSRKTSTATITAAASATAYSMDINWLASGWVYYGQPLWVATINATANIPGVFEYTSPDAILNAGTFMVGLRFTPSDLLKYKVTTGLVSVTVHKGYAVIAGHADITGTFGYVVTGTITSSSGSAITMESTNTAVCIVQSWPTSGTYHVTGAVGSAGIYVTSAETANYVQSGPYLLFSVLISKAAQVLGDISTVWTPAPGNPPFPRDLMVGDIGDVTISSWGASGELILYTSSNPAICDVVGKKLTVLGVGQFTITAHQAGNANYEAAADKTTQQFTVNKGLPVITWPDPEPITYGTAISATQLNATANVPGTFVYSEAIGSVPAANTLFTLSVAFTPSDSTNYKTTVAWVYLPVNRASQTVWANIPASVTIGQSSAITVTAYNTQSGSPVTFSSSNTSIASVSSSGVITGVSLGTASILVEQAATSNYNRGFFQRFVDVVKIPITYVLSDWAGWVKNRVRFSGAPGGYYTITQYGSLNGLGYAVDSINGNLSNIIGMTFNSATGSKCYQESGYFKVADRADPTNFVLLYFSAWFPQISNFTPRIAACTTGTKPTASALINTWNIVGSSIYDQWATGAIQFMANGTFASNLQDSGGSSTCTGVYTYNATTGQLTMTYTYCVEYTAGAVYSGIAQGNDVLFSMVSSNGWTLTFSR